jgi:hypothetical protein
MVSSLHSCIFALSTKREQNESFIESTKLRVRHPHWVFRSLHLSFPFRSQTIELSLLKEVAYSGLPPIGRLNQAQQLQAVRIPGEARVVWPSKWLLPNLNPALVQALYFLAYGIVDVGSIGFTVLFKILFRKEARRYSLAALPQRMVMRLESGSFPFRAATFLANAKF